MCNEASQILQLKVEFRFHTITAFRLYVGYSAQLKGRGIGGASGSLFRPVLGKKVYGWDFFLRRSVVASESLV